MDNMKRNINEMKLVEYNKNEIKIMEEKDKWLWKK